jgi:TetR/AcrR family transcriptional regulator
MATTVAPSSSERRLLEAGKRLFAAQGYENTTTSAIARAAGTSESQLVKHFGGKEGLLQRIFEEGWLQLGFVYAAASVSTTPLDAIRVIFELLIKMLSQDRDLRDLLLFEGRRIRGKNSEILVTSGYRRLQQEVTHVVERVIQGSVLEQKIRPRAVTSGLIGMLESMLRDQAMSERQTGSPDPTAEEIRTMFQLLSGCLAEAANHPHPSARP